MNLGTLVKVLGGPYADCVGVICSAEEARMGMRWVYVALETPFNVKPDTRFLPVGLLKVVEPKTQVLYAQVCWEYTR